MTGDSLSFELANSERRIAHAANKGFVIEGVLPKQVWDRLCFADPARAGQGGSSVLQIKFSAKFPAIANPQTVSGHCRTTQKTD